MKFSTNKAVEAPVDFAFDKASDFDALAGRARSYGATVTPRFEGDAVPGAAWDITFQFRGRDREVFATLTALDAPNHYALQTVMEGLVAETKVALKPLSPTRTQLHVGCTLRANTLTARLLLQSLKLAKGRLSRRFEARVADYANLMSDAYRNGQRGS